MNVFKFVNERKVDCHASTRNLAGSLREVMERNDDISFYLEMIYACKPSTRSLITFLSRQIQRMPLCDEELSLILQKYGVELDFFLRTGRWLGGVAVFFKEGCTDDTRRGWLKSYIFMVWDQYRVAAQEESLYLNNEIERTKIPYHYRDGINGPTNKEHGKNAKRFLNETMEWAIELLREEGVV